MASTISVALGVEGAREFKNSMEQSNAAIKALGSELKLTTAQFAGQEKSEGALKAKNDVLERTILTLNEKLAEQEKALDAVGKEFGEGSKETLKYQDEVNKTKLAIQEATNELENNTAELQKNEDAAGKAGDAGEGFGKRLASAAGSAAKVVAGITAAATAAATGLAALTIDAAYAADDLNTLSKQTGISTEELQKFQYASEVIDVPMETLTGSMAKLTKNMATAAKGSGDAYNAFNALGVAITDESGELRSNDEVFSEVIAKLGEMENETQRDAYAMQIFGKSAQDLNPLILGGADALKELGQQAEDAGLILSQDTLDGLNEVSDATDTFKATMSGAKNVIASSFAAPMAEAVNLGTQTLQKLLAAYQTDGIDGMINALTTAMPELLGVITSVLPTVVSEGTQIILSLTEGIMSMLPEIISAGITILTTLITSIGEMLPELIPVAIDAVLMIGETLIDNIDVLIDAGISLLFGLAQGLIDAIPRLIEKAPVIIEKLVNALTDNLPMLVKAALDLTIMLAEGLIKAIPELIKAIPQIITSLVTGLIEAGKEMWNVGKDLIAGLWEGIKSCYEDIKKKITGFFSGIVDSVKGFLGIHSPSKVFARIGEYCADGLGVGFDDEMKNVERSMQRAIPTPTIVGNVTSAGAAGMVSPGGGADIVINLTSAIDGTALARNQYRYNLAEMARHGGSLVMG